MLQLERNAEKKYTLRCHFKVKKRLYDHKLAVVQALLDLMKYHRHSNYSTILYYCMLEILIIE